MKIIKYKDTSHMPILRYIYIFLIRLYPYPASACLKDAVVQEVVSYNGAIGTLLSLQGKWLGGGRFFCLLALLL